MRHVTAPDFAALPSLALIIDSQKTSTKTALLGAAPAIAAAYKAYDKAAPNRLHQLQPVALSPQLKALMKNVFKRRLGKFGALYTSLDLHLESTHNSVCPYCNFGEQWEQDHYLPKAVFPEFSLYPKNLVPICKVCNGKKLSKYQKGGARLFTHAFLELDGVTGLLKVDIQYSSTITVQYTLCRPPALPTKTFRVLERHFTELHLDARYKRQASTSIARLVHVLGSAQNRKLGQARLQRKLKQLAKNRALLNHPNHWEVALLQCLAASTDFVKYIFKNP